MKLCHMKHPQPICLAIGAVALLLICIFAALWPAKMLPAERWTVIPTYITEVPDGCLPSFGPIALAFERDKNGQIGELAFNEQRIFIQGAVQTKGLLHAKAEAKFNDEPVVITLNGTTTQQEFKGTFDIVFFSPVCNVMKSDSSGRTWDDRIINLRGDLSGERLKK
jgi:hypothetical protein